jgi:hypothetical protein
VVELNYCNNSKRKGRRKRRKEEGGIESEVRVMKEENRGQS